MQLREARFVERYVYQKAVQTGRIVAEDERKHIFALVGYCLRVEPDTPARLLTYILKGGERCRPWRSDLSATDWKFAENRLAQLKAKAEKPADGRARWVESYSKPPDQQKAELEAKYGLKPTKTDLLIAELRGEA